MEFYKVKLREKTKLKKWKTKKCQWWKKKIKFQVRQHKADLHFVAGEQEIDLLQNQIWLLFWKFEQVWFCGMAGIYFYLQQEGYVLSRECLSVCEQSYSKT